VKPIVILLGILTFAASTGYGQPPPNADFFSAGFRKAGIRIGMNSATATLQSYMQESTISDVSGIVLSGILEYTLSEHFALVAEPQYLRKGASFEAVMIIPVPPFNSTITVTGSGKFDYIEIPLLFKAGGEVGGVRLYVVAGPSVNFLISKHIEYNGPSWNADFGGEDVKWYEYAIVVGIGAEYPMTQQFSFAADLRYSSGLNNVILTKMRAGQPSSNLVGSWRSTCTVVSLSVLFNL